MQQGAHFAVSTPPGTCYDLANTALVKSFTNFHKAEGWEHERSS